MKIVGSDFVKKVFPFVKDDNEVNVQEVEIEMSSKDGTVKKENPIPLFTVKCPDGRLAGIEYQQKTDAAPEEANIFYFVKSAILKTFEIGDRIGGRGGLVLRRSWGYKYLSIA